MARLKAFTALGVCSCKMIQCSRSQMQEMLSRASYLTFQAYFMKRNDHGQAFMHFSCRSNMCRDAALKHELLHAASYDVALLIVRALNRGNAGTAIVHRKPPRNLPKFRLPIQSKFQNPTSDNGTLRTRVTDSTKRINLPGCWRLPRRICCSHRRSPAGVRVKSEWWSDGAVLYRIGQRGHFRHDLRPESRSRSRLVASRA